MTHLTRGRRFAALGASGALVAAGLAIAPAAQAAETAPTLRWSISQQFIEHFTAPYVPGTAITATDGATFADGAITFAAESAETEGDLTTLTYGGSVLGAFGTMYSVRVEDPAITVDEAGDGEITALVSGTQGAPAEPAETTPARVTVAEFSGATLADGTLSGTPKWDGVLAADSETAVALGLAAGKPVDGKAFHPEFLAQLTPGVRAHFHASGAGSDAKKAVAAFEADVAVAAPSITTSVAGARPSSGLDLKVTGSGFTATDGNPGDNGVYVGVAPAGAEIDFDDMDAGMAQMVGVDWVTGDQIVDGSFTRVVNVPTAKLKKGTKYAVYTWRAHTHSTTSQDTVTPVSIPWARLAKVKAATKVALAKPTTTKAGKVAVTFGGKYGKATGKAKVTVKKGAKKVGAVRTVKLTKAGKVNVKLAKAAKGTYTVTVKLLATPDYKATVVKRQYKVTK